MTAVARITAIDRFIKGCREDGIYDDLNACCVMAGWDSLAGALTPLKGAAPSNNGFDNTDYDRGGIGLKGNGSSKYLNSNRASNADGQSDHHAAVFVSSQTAAGGPGYERYFGAQNTALSPATSTNIYQTSTGYFAGFSRNNASGIEGTAIGVGIAGISRSSPSAFLMRIAGSTLPSGLVTSYTPSSLSAYVFCRNLNGAPASYTNARLAYYSIGSATDLALLDARVSTLMADLRAIEEAGFDRDAIAYIRAVEEADGAYLETSVKTAINNLVSGLKADSLWDAIGSSCLLCGPRTLAGALVPLRGDAPTAEGGWASGDYDRSTGMKGNGTSLYLNTGVNNSSFTPDDFHMACYVTEAGTAGETRWLAGAGLNQTGASEIFTAGNNYQYRNQSSNAGTSSGFADTLTGLMASSRYEDEFFDFRAGSLSSSSARVSQSLFSGIIHIFKTSQVAATSGFNGRLAYYSLGSQVDMGTLRTHLDAYVTAIGAAI
jgi:hypothetical protein